MNDLKTVEGDLIKTPDSLREKQIEDVQRMRASLLVCNDESFNVKQALGNITVMQIYHQLTRVVRYTEIMDKIEDKLYESMEATIDSINPQNTNAWVSLSAMQSQLQSSMLMSQKLLQPYLDMIKSVDKFVEATDFSDTATAEIMDRNSREKVRNLASSIMASLPETTEENQ